MKRLVAVAALAAAVVSASVGFAVPAGAAGNDENAKLCQKGGWKDLRGSDGAPFNNQGECVAYAAQGGTLMPGTPEGMCASLGGEFGADNETAVIFESVAWTCNDWPTIDFVDFVAKVPLLRTVCAPPNLGVGSGNGLTGDFTCGVLPAP
jgi:hypothetical protein